MPTGYPAPAALGGAPSCIALAPPPRRGGGRLDRPWSASPQPDWGADFFAPVGIPRSLRDQTIRQVARVSLGGEQGAGRALQRIRRPAD